MSDLEVVESDSDGKTHKKKQSERKASHTVKPMSQEEVQRLNKSVNKTIVERKSAQPETVPIDERRYLNTEGN